MVNLEKTLSKIECLLNIKEQRIVCIAGIPGSGKSTLSKELEKVGYHIVNTDHFRGVISKTKPDREDWTLSMHESDQEHNKEAWEMAYKDAQERLSQGKSIVFDAMFHTPKSRRELIEKLKKFNVPFYAIYNDVTLETSKERNDKRFTEGGRRVPDFVLAKVWRNQSIPSKEEGFSKIFVIHSDLEINTEYTLKERSILINQLQKNVRETIEELYRNNQLESVFPSFYKCWGISQDNSHHTQELHEHMIKATELLENKNPVLLISTLLHDIGKFTTKEFFVKIIKENDLGFKIGDKLVAVRDNGFAITVKIDSKNGESMKLLPLDILEKDMNAHFYFHQQVGAILARRDLIRLGFEEQFVDDVYYNILYHMDLPYKVESNKSMNKLIRKVSPERITDLLLIRKADRLSSNTNVDEFLNDFNEIRNQILSLIKFQ